MVQTRQAHMARYAKDSALSMVIMCHVIHCSLSCHASHCIVCDGKRFSSGKAKSDKF